MPWAAEVFGKPAEAEEGGASDAAPGLVSLPNREAAESRDSHDAVDVGV